ncbi:serine/threonine protein kinase [Pseudanabaena sp. FACHB-1998]|uniref:serine/threonine-protein kinase n=1 Tax=Pseudanabaena sp. FACHB-1998 TaxID=2692858 RepID=UPI0016804FC9|nr:serine/threonine-protein kinase [Pseudanabaena sp. FACHB-1998]MBD2175465.1 serine/threonine protein kinase [Pseudanabaena sp. FACHB-1998]
MPAKVLDGRYKLIKKIGAGGFGHTFIARDMRRPGSPPCVVKQLKPASDDPTFIREARRLFNTEAETLEKLGRHDQIPQLLAYFEEDKQFFLVQEFIEGRSLHDEMKARLPEVSDLDNEPQDRILEQLSNLEAPIRDKQLSEIEVLKILADVLDVLDFVHSEGVIHRDIKPDNLIRRKKDQKIVLIDFGAVRAMQDANTQLTADEKGESRFTVTIGTPGYMPSEQCAGRPNYSSDIYALGMVAIKALTGYAPTDLPNDPATGEVVWRDKAKVSNGLAMVLTRMVRYHYTQRYQSVREVKQGITTFATMTEVERQATTSKIMRSTTLTESEQSTSMRSNSGSRSSLSTSTRRVSSSSNASASSNAGVLFLFGGLLAVVAVVAAFALPSMMRNKSQPIVVNNPPITSAINPEVNPTAAPNAPLSNEPVNQNLSLEANRESLVIPSKMGGNGTHSYTLQARSGQILNVGLTGTGMVMNVLDSQGIALPNGANIVNGDVAIAADGIYTVQLRGITNANELPYQLRLALKDKNAIASPNPIATPLPFNSPLPNNPPVNPSVNPSVNPNPVPNATTPPPVAPTPAATPTPTTPVPQIEIKVRNR